MSESGTHPIYGYIDYREYLNWRFSKAGGDQTNKRGSRRLAAEFLRCQPSFVSQVLNGKNDLSLEHAYRLNEFLGHSPNESQYFMAQVMHGKAGSKELEAFFYEQLEKLRQGAMQVSNVLRKVELNEAGIVRYYSDWNHIAIHLLVSMKQFQNKKKLQEKLKLSDDEMTNALKFLESVQLIRVSKDSIQTGEANIHLKKTSPYAYFASQQLRLSALRKLNLAKDQNLHYGTHFTISKKNLLRVRKKMLDFIGELSREIESSDPDTLCTLVFDMIEHAE